MLVDQRFPSVQQMPEPLCLQCLLHMLDMRNRVCGTAFHDLGICNDAAKVLNAHIDRRRPLVIQDLQCTFPQSSFLPTRPAFLSPKKVTTITVAEAAKMVQNAAR